MTNIVISDKLILVMEVKIKVEGTLLKILLPPFIKSINIYHEEVEGGFNQLLRCYEIPVKHIVMEKEKK